MVARSRVARAMELVGSMVDTCLVGDWRLAAMLMDALSRIAEL